MTALKTYAYGETRNADLIFAGNLSQSGYLTENIMGG
jgi:hypothetical protein